MIISSSVFTFSLRLGWRGFRKACERVRHTRIEKYLKFHDDIDAVCFMSLFFSPRV